MRGFEKSAAIAVLGLLLAGGSIGRDIEWGRSIYQRGIGQDPINVKMFGQRVDSTGTFTCAACHGEYGAGGSEGGVVAPSLIVDGNRPVGEVEDWVARALDGGEGGAHEFAGRRMPRFLLSARDRSALASYIRTFPSPPVPGLTADRLVIGLDTTGSGLDDAGRAALLSEMTDLFGKVAGYGLFGRLIEVHDVTGQVGSADVFSVIMWDPRSSADAPLRISVRPPSGNGASDLCASLQPSLMDQYQALTNYLDRRGVRYRTIWSSASPPFALPSTTEKIAGDPTEYEVEIRLGHAAFNQDGRPTYLFADLVGPSASSSLTADAHLIIPVRIREQERAASDILKRHSIDSRSAGVIAMINKAAQTLFTALALAGRRISVRDTCERVSTQTRQSYAIDDLYYKGEVLEIAKVL